MRQITLPSRWPAVMTAQTLAEYLDLGPRALTAAIARGEVPSPNAVRTRGGRAEKVWLKAAVDLWLTSLVPDLAAGDEILEFA